jgi:hypothetical protein
MSLARLRRIEKQISEIGTLNPNRDKPKSDISGVLGIIGICILVLILLGKCFTLPSTQAQPSTHAKQQPLILRSTEEVVHDQFENYRRISILILEDHLRIHPNCDLIQLRGVIDSIYFNYDLAGNISPYRAQSFPVSKKNLFPRIIFNLKSEWNDTIGPMIIIHEALHIAKVCGPDHPFRTYKRASCYLFNEVRMSSSDIDNALREHFAEYRSKGKKLIQQATK